MKRRAGIEFSICTYNRVDLLQQGVLALLPQLIQGSSQLTIVDNNSSDETRNWVIRLAEQNPLVRYLSEPKQGLSHARNTAWREADFEWVFYLDDDCVVSPDLVKAAWSLVQPSPSFSGAGGKVLPLRMDGFPEASLDDFGSFILPYTETTFIEKEFIRGPCMMFRADALQQVGGFNSRLGMAGNQMRYGEEIELQIRLRQEGHQIVYAPSVEVYHVVREEKMKVGWILASEYARRRDKRTFEPLPFGRSVFSLLKTIAGRFFWLPVYITRLVILKNYRFRNFILDEFKPLMYRWGDLVGSLKRM